MHSSLTTLFQFFTLNYYSIVPVAEINAIEGLGLNHGIELAGGYLYASTPTTVYRWPYQTGQITAGNADDVQEVIVGMDRLASDELGAPDGHTTRTLAFDADDRWLYVSIGSLGNVDADSFRSRIRRFDIAAWDSVQPLNYNDGEVFADGLRNEVGLAFDSHGDLWGVENGADRLYRDDLGGDIHNDNPSEELNRFREDQAGETWGYPYCWSEYCLPVENGGSGMKGANTPWAWPSFINSGYTDDWCEENTNRSVMSMPAHSAPLGITFYNWRDMSQEEYNESGCRGLPKSMDKYAFIAFHGSWNRKPSTGYKVAFVPFDDEGNPTALPIDLFRHNGNEAEWPDPVRPVDVQFDSCGSLLVTEDGTGSVIKITYSGGYFDEYSPIETDVADGASCSPFQLPSSSPTNSPTKLPTSPPTLPPSSLPSQNPVASAPVPAVPTPIFSSEKPPSPGPISSAIISPPTLPPSLLPSQNPVVSASVPAVPAPLDSSGKPPLSGPPTRKTEGPSASAKSWTLEPDNSPNNGFSAMNSLFSGICICVCVFYSTVAL
mmetsp:Transcript_20862/g.38278  ORF Transcript_20862/g.38278 Transcript_20862/m.38278 type:complete len:548 (-) Transcript_20862:64-1707(-)